MPAWNLHLEGARQADLIITRDDQPEITVDNLEVAQFIYLLLNNERFRHVIGTITSKVVLILGRFTPERKAVLDALRRPARGAGHSRCRAGLVAPPRGFGPAGGLGGRPGLR